MKTCTFDVAHIILASISFMHAIGLIYQCKMQTAVK